MKHKFRQRLLRYLCKHLVKQGFDHKNFITEYFTIVVTAARKEFTEDNKPTLVAFLDECYEDAKNSVDLI